MNNRIDSSSLKEINDERVYKFILILALLVLTIPNLASFLGPIATT